jgi:hypothetical protein
MVGILSAYVCVPYLDASTHLYMRVCPFVGRSVRRSVRWLVGQSVMRFFFQIAEIDKKQHGIIGKVETLFLDCNILHKKF